MQEERTTPGQGRSQPSKVESHGAPWGEHDLAEGETRYWRIGPLELWISNLPNEWRAYHRQLGEGEEPGDPAAPPEDAQRARFGFRRSGSRVRLTPLLADRSVVLRPEEALVLPSGEEATLFVSTPVWLRLGLEPVGELLELPSQRLSDTWFGPSTMVGELCYASRSPTYLELSALERQPHQVITPLQLSNGAADPLSFEKVKLPVQYLSVYRAKDGALWSEAVALRREEAGELAAFDIRTNPGSQASGARKIGPARLSGGRNLVVRAFAKLFRSE